MLIADEGQMPLLGKRIMITAPRQYAAKLASRLVTAGARPVWVPSISITPIPEQDCQKVPNKVYKLFLRLPPVSFILLADQGCIMVVDVLDLSCSCQTASLTSVATTILIPHLSFPSVSIVHYVNQDCIVVHALLLPARAYKCLLPLPRTKLFSAAN